MYKHLVSLVGSLLVTFAILLLIVNIVMLREDSDLMLPPVICILAIDGYGGCFYDMPEYINIDNPEYIRKPRTSGGD